MVQPLAIESWEQRLLAARSEQDARPVVAEIARALPDKGDERRRRLVDLVRRRKAAGWAVDATPARMTFAEYAAAEGANWSKLKELRRSPLHYQHALANERADSDTLAVGRGTHCAILEPERFAADFIAWDGTRRGKEWQAAKAAAAAQGQTILKREDLERCADMGRAVRAHPLAAPYLDGIEAEQSLFWIDPATGIKCKARLDGVNPHLGCIVEIKTARDIETRAFQAAAHRLGYHGQVAHYQSGRAETHQGEVWPVVIIAVESAAPHDIAIYLPNEEMMLAGLEERDAALSQLAACIASGKWPGRYTEPVEMSLPAWAFDNLGGMEVSVDGTSTEF